MTVMAMIMPNQIGSNPSLMMADNLRPHGAGVPVVAEGDWGGAFQGDVRGKLVVFQQPEPREEEPEEE